MSDEPPKSKPAPTPTTRIYFDDREEGMPLEPGVIFRSDLRPGEVMAELDEPLCRTVRFCVLVVTVGLLILCLGGCWLDSHYRLEAIKAGGVLRTQGPLLNGQWEGEAKKP